jgi:hypothetical protein
LKDGETLEVTRPIHKATLGSGTNEGNKFSIDFGGGDPNKKKIYNSIYWKYDKDGQWG